MAVRKEFDMTILLLAVVLTCFGVVMVYSCTRSWPRFPDRPGLCSERTADRRKADGCDLETPGRLP